MLFRSDAGSDPGAMRTHARRDGSDWILNGSKMWITNGTVADVAIVWANTDEGIRGFIVEQGTPGFTAPEIHRKLSLRASITSELVLQDVRVPDEQRLPEATSLRGPLSCLNEARYGIVWGVVGAARRHRGVVFEPFFRDPVVLVCPPGHRFAGRSVTVDELREDTLIVMQEGAGVRQLLEDELRNDSRTVASSMPTRCAARAIYPSRTTGSRRLLRIGLIPSSARFRPPRSRRSCPVACVSMRCSTTGVGWATASRQASGFSRITSSGSRSSGSRTTPTSTSDGPLSEPPSSTTSLSSSAAPNAPAFAPAASTS